MRSSLCFLLLFGLLLVLSPEAAAQERVKNRVKNRANQNVDRKVDQTVDQAFDAVGNLFKKKNKKTEDQATEPQSAEPAAGAEENQKQANPGLLGAMMGSNEPWEPVRNDQLISYTMEFTTSRKGKEEKTTMDMCFDTWLIGYVIRQEGDDQVTRLLLDNEAGTMTTIVQEKDKAPEGVRMRQFRMQMTEEELQEEIEEMQIEQTGRRRNIDGYDCEEVIITNEDGVTTVWITDDIDADWTAMYRMFMTQSRGRGRSPLEGTPPSLQGFPIEQTFVHANGKETTTVNYRNIKLGNAIDRAPLDIEGIPVQEVGF